jgi:hypothetical protein
LYFLRLKIICGIVDSLKTFQPKQTSETATLNLSRNKNKLNLHEVAKEKINEHY